MSFIAIPATFFPLRDRRRIGEIEVQVVLNETTTDTLTITKQPVQQGASISDHAFMEPTVFNCVIRFRENNIFSGSFSSTLSKTYQDLLTLQKERIPFNITTPKRIYSNMLINTLGCTTDKTTENVLAINLSCQEVIRVPIGIVQVPRSQQRNPGVTGKTENAGQKSALFTVLGSFF